MKIKKISSRADKKINIGIAFGHFATNHSHINCYIDLTEIRTNHAMSKRAAALLAGNYKFSNTAIDTVVCLEGTKVLGAFMADEIAASGRADINSGAEIYVLTPEFNSNNQLVFRENMQHMIRNKSILLLLSSVTTGKTVNRALDCLRYYDGRLCGISAFFSARENEQGIPVYSVFDSRDLPDYRTCAPDACDMCAQNIKLDAIVNSYGYLSL